MLKKYELLNQESCLNKALPDEMVFVLLARDASAPAAIRAWVQDRINRGLNAPSDEKLRNARAIALAMEQQRGVGDFTKPPEFVPGSVE